MNYHACHKLFYFLAVPWFELRASCLLGRHSTIPATQPAHKLFSKQDIYMSESNWAPDFSSPHSKRVAPADCSLFLWLAWTSWWAEALSPCQKAWMATAVTTQCSGRRLGWGDTREGSHPKMHLPLALWWEQFLDMWVICHCHSVIPAGQGLSALKSGSQSAYGNPIIKDLVLHQWLASVVLTEL
jgi:hypothetical protein